MSVVLWWAVVDMSVDIHVLSFLKMLSNYVRHLYLYTGCTI